MKNLQASHHKRAGSILSKDRELLYQNLVEDRRKTPMAVIEGNVFHLWRDEQVSSWKVPWSIPNGNRLIMKMEHLSDYNPSGSMYDRLYPHLFRILENRGLLVPGEDGTPVIECSAGNAGAAFCHTAVQLGFQNHTILIPKDIYPARIDQVYGYGGNVQFSPSGRGEFGYIQMIEETLREDAKGKGRIRKDRSRMIPVTNIIKVPNEPYAKIVRETHDTLKSLKLPPRIDTFLFGVGAGNTISQVSVALRSMQDTPVDVQVVEFKECPFVATLREGKRPPENGGWPAGDMGGTIFGVPLEKLNLRLEVINQVLPLNQQEREEGRSMANEALGLCAGRPTGMGIIGALKLAKKMHNQQIFIIVFDSIAKYEDCYDAVMDVDFEHGRPIRMSQRKSIRLAS